MELFILYFISFYTDAYFLYLFQLDFLVSNTNYSVYIAAARKKRDTDSFLDRNFEKDGQSSSELSKSGGEDKKASGHIKLENAKENYQYNDDREVNDDPLWDESYSDDMEYDTRKGGEDGVRVEEWESVGEWASTVLIVHAVIISEAEKWPTSAHCKISSS